MRSRVFILALAMMLLFSLNLLAAEKPVYGGTLHSYSTSDWDTLDPAQASSFAAGAMAVRIFDGLVRFDYYSNEIVPCLATKWDVSQDRLTYTFYLRKGVKFHNGREFKATDVKYSFDRLFDKKTNSPGTWAFEMIKGTDAMLAGSAKTIEGVKVIDDYTVSFTLKYPFGLFIKHMTLPYGLIVPKEEVEKYGDKFSDNAIGTGPWKLVKWDHDNIMILEANKTYFEGRPYLDRLEYRVIPEELVVIAEFEAGNLDFSSIPTSEWDKWTKDNFWKNWIYKTTDLSTYYIGLNSKIKPLDNPKVRQAIAHALDINTMLATLRKGKDTLATGPLPPALDGFINLPAREYDPVKAKKLLAEAGYPNGFSIQYWTTNVSDRVQFATAVQAYLAQVGIKVEIIKNDWSTMFAAIQKGEVPMFYLSWWADYADPYNFLMPLFYTGQNRIHFSDPVIDKMIKEMEKTNSSEVRYELAKKIQQRVYELTPYVWAWHTTTYTLKQPWIKGELWHQMYDADKMVTTWIDPTVKKTKK